MFSPAHAQAAIDFLDARFGIEALYLFGSAASGTAHAGSDIDLSAIFTTRVAPAALLSAAGELQARLGAPVDLIDLDRASPILAMQVLRYGRLLKGHRSARRIAFEAGAAARYQDLQRVREPQVRAMFDELRRG